MFLSPGERDAHRARTVAAGVTIGALYDTLRDAGGQDELLSALREGTLEQALPFFAQLAGFHVRYPGGVGAYITKVRDLNPLKRSSLLTASRFSSPRALSSLLLILLLFLFLSLWGLFFFFP